MTCTVGGFVDLATQQLNDAESGNSNCTWSRDLIRQYVQTAVSVVAGTRPDLFTTVKDIDLEPGCIHYICEECDEFNEVMSVDGNDCAVESEPSKYGTKLATKFAALGATCSLADGYGEAGSYEHGGITYDKNNPCYFKTVNAVPARGVTAKVSCVKTPSTDDLTYDDAELPPAVCAKGKAAVLEYVMYLALEKDLESEVGSVKQPMHFNNFVTLLRLNERASDRYQAEDS